MTKYIKDKTGKFAGSIGDGKNNSPKALAASPKKINHSLDDIDEPTLDDLIASFESSRTPITDQEVKEILNHSLDRSEEQEGNYSFHLLQAPMLYQAAIAEADDNPGIYLAQIESEDGQSGYGILVKEEFEDEEEADEWASEQVLLRYREYALFQLRYRKDAEVARMRRHQHIEELGQHFTRNKTSHENASEVTLETSFGNRLAQVAQLGRKYHVTVSEKTPDGSYIIHEANFDTHLKAVDFAEEMTLLGE